MNVWPGQCESSIQWRSNHHSVEQMWGHDCINRNIRFVSHHKTENTQHTRKMVSFKRHTKKAKSIPFWWGQLLYSKRSLVICGLKRKGVISRPIYPRGPKALRAFTKLDGISKNIQNCFQCSQISFCNITFVSPAIFFFTSNAYSPFSCPVIICSSLASPLWNHSHIWLFPWPLP